MARAPINLPRIMRTLKVINEKLDLALSGHGERITKLETGHLDHETRLTKVERLAKWLEGKINGASRERR